MATNPVTLKAERSRLLTEARDEIAILKARLALYEQAIREMGDLRADLSGVAAHKSYIDLEVENATLRETLRWVCATPTYSQGSEIKAHVVGLIGASR